MQSMTTNEYKNLCAACELVVAWASGVGAMAHINHTIEKAAATDFRVYQTVDSYKGSNIPVALNLIWEALGITDPTQQMRERLEQEFGEDCDRQIHELSQANIVLESQRDSLRSELDKLKLTQEKDLLAINAALFDLVERTSHLGMLRVKLTDLHDKIDDILYPPQEDTSDIPF